MDLLQAHELEQMERERKQKAIEEYTKLMQELAAGHDDDDHEEADGYLCLLLRALGCKEIVEAYETMPKWYS